MRTTLNIPHNFKHIIILFLIIFVDFNKSKFKSIPIVSEALDYEVHITTKVMNRNNQCKPQYRFNVILNLGLINSVNFYKMKSPLTDVSKWRKQLATKSVCIQTFHRVLILITILI